MPQLLEAELLWKLASLTWGMNICTVLSQLNSVHLLYICAQDVQDVQNAQDKLMFKMEKMEGSK